MRRPSGVRLLVRLMLLRLRVRLFEVRLLRLGVRARLFDARLLRLRLRVRLFEVGLLRLRLPVRLLEVGLLRLGLRARLLGARLGLRCLLAHGRLRRLRLPRLGLGLGQARFDALHRRRWLRCAVRRSARFVHRQALLGDR